MKDIESTQLLEPSRVKRSKFQIKLLYISICFACCFVTLTIWNGLGLKRQHIHSLRFDDYRGSLEDPESAQVAFTILAIGDWGATLGKENGDPGSCCKLYNGAVDPSRPRFQVDYYAQKYVAELMAQSADELKPIRILGHGDNFYWNGVGTVDVKYRMEESFESIYSAPSLLHVPWINVAGNHDLGGNSFLCGESDNAFRECKSMDELLRYLDIRFEAQANYTSPNSNRWILKDHYYVEHVVKNGVSVDIFNLDTNHAEIHGAKDVCCQCYDYSVKVGQDKSVCDTIEPGDAACFGGNRTLFHACVDKINQWADDSFARAIVDIAASTAIFKIVNTHYSPHYHMENDKMMKWYSLCQDAGVTVWFNGHTHGFNHDISVWGTHFFENGGGGGYWTRNFPGISNGIVKNQWRVAGNPYGFMELSFSQDWLKVQFVTFDSRWTFGGVQLNATHIGGIQRGHCWFIPRTFQSSHGVECLSSVNGPIGFPLDSD